MSDSLISLTIADVDALLKGHLSERVAEVILPSKDVPPLRFADLVSVERIVSDQMAENATEQKAGDVYGTTLSSVPIDSEVSHLVRSLDTFVANLMSDTDMTARDGVLEIAYRSERAVSVRLDFLGYLWQSTLGSASASSPITLHYRVTPRFAAADGWPIDVYAVLLSESKYLNPVYVPRSRYYLSASGAQYAQSVVVDSPVWFRRMATETTWQRLGSAELGDLDVRIVWPTVLLSSGAAAFQSSSTVLLQDSPSVPLVSHGAPAFAPVVFSSQFGLRGQGKSKLLHPLGLAMYTNGCLAVCDSGNARLQVRSSSGKLLTNLDEFDAPRKFTEPYAAAASPSNRLYVIDGKSRTLGWFVTNFSLDGSLEFKFGGFVGDKGKRTPGHVLQPAAVAVSAIDERVVVLDHHSNKVKVFAADGSFLLKFGKRGSGTGEFSLPMGVAVDSANNIYVTDSSMHRVQVFSAAGQPLHSFGSRGAMDGQFQRPVGVHCMDADGRVVVVVCDYGNNRLQLFDGKGRHLISFGLRGKREGEFFGPFGLTGAGSMIAVSDEKNHRIQVFDVDARRLLLS